MKPNFELLKEAYAIIDGIPDERINLDILAGNQLYPYSVHKIGCGTIACAAGWLAYHPTFQARGLSVTRSGTLCYNDRVETFSNAMSKVFHIPMGVARDLFSVVGASVWDASFGSNLSERQSKAIWQHRVRCYLREQGQL